MAEPLRMLVATALAAAALTAFGAAPASARVPPGFVGVVADGPIADAGFDPARETRAMVASGVESIRVVVHWADAQPYADAGAVPPGEKARFRLVDGVPTSFERVDPLMRDAAARRIRVLPVITTAPGWAAKYPADSASPPSGTASYARFARAAVERYGPRGTFWTENPTLPRRPIRHWQLWNEPNLRTSWTDRAWPAPYVALVRAARRSIEGADPGARIVLAGLANFSWRSLAAIYRVSGSRRLFDRVAVHPYTREVAGLRTILRRVRRTMSRNGDRRKPIVVTEFGWPSAKGKAEGFGIETTERGQARKAAAALRMLAAQRRRLRLSNVYWHNWIGTDEGTGSIWPYSGLRHYEAGVGVTSKPALASFRRTALRLEDCRRKASMATRCARRR